MLSRGSFKVPVNCQSLNQLDLSSEVPGIEIEVTITAAVAACTVANVEADVAAKMAFVEVANAASRITCPYLGRCQGRIDEC